MEIIAHRGATSDFPENTLPAFERAIELGADGIELDVRLTADGVPVVYHYFYLDEFTSGSGSISALTHEELRFIEIPHASGPLPISSLDEVLEAIAGRTGLEIELKGPEGLVVEVVADTLRRYRTHWETFEITSYEPMLLAQMKSECSIPVDLLTHKSETWMRDDYVIHSSVHRARLAGARAVHLHPTQLSTVVVDSIRREGVDVHSYEVNDRSTLDRLAELKVSRFTTDRLRDALAWRPGRE